MAIETCSAFSDLPQIELYAQDERAYGSGSVGPLPWTWEHHRMNGMQRFMSESSFQSGLRYDDPGTLHGSQQICPLFDFKRPHEPTGPWPDPFRSCSPDRATISSSQNSVGPHHHDEASPADLSSPRSPFKMPDYSAAIHHLSAFPESVSSYRYAPDSACGGGDCIALAQIQHYPDECPEPIEELKLDEYPEPESEYYSEPHLQFHSNVDIAEDVKCVHPDEGLGESIHDAESQLSSRSDVDEVDDMVVGHDDPDSDQEYKPRSPTTKRGRRRASNSSTNSGKGTSNKRNHGRKASGGTNGPTHRVVKTKKAKASNHGSGIGSSAAVGTSGANGESSVTNSSGNNAASFALRPFPCTLAQYGCESTFTSKNEWKRHVSTQHIKLGYWRCDLCRDSASSNPNDFNRKDLFTQHLRRMHFRPAESSGSSSKSIATTTAVVSEDNLSQHQTRCYRRLRAPPQRSACLFCSDKFESWDERMEHVGKHMETFRKRNQAVPELATWNEDPDLHDYLEHQGLVVANINGKLTLGDGVPLDEK
ncbi:hypothetical protein BDY21DRAFT_361802 [Lineolata rhizophorae]|uniref:C2H2-type domain-containing protein n=1 Tax=Lineolata rhizophorae TaxID=578093 RepID=A0A6A6P7R8_9PEZI|nr:hypothetical protein BDY21DRAFT_361802 [Lineolata rhizophorae]